MSRFESLPRSGVRHRARSFISWGLTLLLTLGTTFGLLILAQSQTRADPSAVIFIAPHADDEFQFWALAEQRPDDFKIFVTLTRGEETKFCEPEVYVTALQESLGEAAPSAAPDGRWGENCERARIESALRYFEAMSESDGTIPGDFQLPEVFYLDTVHAELCRMDGEVENCGVNVAEVLVFHDTEGRGAVVFFNLGDGDLNTDRIAMAVGQLLEQRNEWSLRPDLPVSGLFGAYAHRGSVYPCFDYPHPDHLAVHDALWSIDFKSGVQVSATCTLDPARTLTRLVSKESTRASFELGTDGRRLGAHERFYGWLHTETYPVSTLSERSLFHRVQSFWVRHNN